jgi:hypothetical protein
VRDKLDMELVPYDSQLESPLHLWAETLELALCGWLLKSPRGLVQLVELLALLLLLQLLLLVAAALHFWDETLHMAWLWWLWESPQGLMHLLLLRDRCPAVLLALVLIQLILSSWMTKLIQSAWPVCWQARRDRQAFSRA